MRKSRDLETDVVDRNIVEFLLRMKIWTPEEILPKNSKGEPLVHLKKRNDKLLATRQEFWKPVGFITERSVYINVDGVSTKKILNEAHSVWSKDADKNRGVIIDLLLNLNVWKLPLSMQLPDGSWGPHATETETGLAFGTHFYRTHQPLCWNFLQVLQNQKLCSEGAKRWYFAKTTVAPEKNHFKILVVKDWEWKGNSYYEKKEGGV